jgi:hypothetical protein
MQKPVWPPMESLIPRICEERFCRAILRPMSRRILQLAAGIVLILATLTPLAELFDRWDARDTVPANDTELNIVAWFAGAGLVLILAKQLRNAPAPAATKRCFSRANQTQTVLQPGEEPRPTSTASPPLIPLRI